jgi:copper oxidase (laccase) domain-containing protein
LLAGVLEAAVGQLRAGGAGAVQAALGPCIHAECYEFSPADLDAVAERLGPAARGVTAAGRPALDVPAAVRAALARAEVDLVHDADVCTGCSPDHYSHRASGDRQRQALVVHLPS